MINSWVSITDLRKTYAIFSKCWLKNIAKWWHFHWTLLCDWNFIFTSCAKSFLPNFFRFYGGMRTNFRGAYRHLLQGSLKRNLTQLYRAISKKDHVTFKYATLPVMFPLQFCEYSFIELPEKLHVSIQTFLWYIGVFAKLRLKGNGQAANVHLGESKISWQVDLFLETSNFRDFILFGSYHYCNVNTVS